jgi:acetyl esterase/lipase
MRSAPSLASFAFASLAAVLLSAAAPGQAQPTHAGLTYAVLGSQPLKLDLYLPAAAPAPYPVLVFIHGGGWAGGSRYPVPNPCVVALSQGFAVASLDYRLTTQAAQFAPYPVTFPAQIHDVKGAIRWLRANAATYQLDPTRFASFGTSAGGHLSALLATSGGVAELEGTVGGNPGFSSLVQAAGDFFGPIDLVEMNGDVRTPPGSTIDHDASQSPESNLIGWNGPGQGIGDIAAHWNDPTPPYPELVSLVQAANPITWIDANDPPMFVGHGTHDTAVPVDQSSRFSAALLAAGVRHDFRAVPNAGHGLGGPIDAVLVSALRRELDGFALPDVGTAFCFGDGSGTSCPCDESFAGAQTGCRHSAIVGAHLNAVGHASVANDSLVLRGDSMPAATVLYFQGSALVAGGAGVAFGDGLRCIAAPQLRLGVKNNVLGWSRYPDAGDAPISARGSAAPGATLHYQAWYRDPATYCMLEQHNLTNAIEITWVP